MKKFAISITATRRKNETGYSFELLTYSTLMVKNARSREEAIGIGTIESNKLFPIKDGYSGHGVLILEIKEKKDEQQKSTKT